MRLQQEEAEQRRNANDKLEMWKKTDIGKKLFAEVQAEVIVVILMLSKIWLNVVKINMVF